MACLFQRESFLEAIIDPLGNSMKSFKKFCNGLNPTDELYTNTTDPTIQVTECRSSAFGLPLGRL